MFPVLEVLVAIILALQYETPATGPLPSLDAMGPEALGVLGLQILGGIAGLLAARWTARPLLRRDIGTAILRHERSSLALRLLFLGLFAAQIHLCRWPLVVHALGLRGVVLLDELLILAPYFLHLVLAWSSSYGVERRFRFRRWSRAGYVFFQLRQRVLPMLPVIFLWTVYDLLALLARHDPGVARFRQLFAHALPVTWAVIISSFVLIMLLAPFLFRLLWGMRPLEDGPVRRRLEAFGERVGFRTRDILYWPTRGNVLNAAIIGLTGRLRYVMITDGLLASLNEDEIEAVYAHEVGHAKHRHMLLLLLFAISLLFVTHLIQVRLPLAAIEAPETVQLAALITLVLLWWGGLFGWISRRFETQADVYGATATAKAKGDPQASAFISALENLAEESGQLRHIRGLRHPSIADRTDFLRSYLSDPEVRTRYRRSIRRLLLIFLLSFCAVTAAAVATLPEEWRLAKARIALEDGEHERAVLLAEDIAPGWRRDEILARAVWWIEQAPMSESHALVTADRILALSRDDPGSERMRLLIGRMLLRAARESRGPRHDIRARMHLEAAGPILGAIARGEARGDGERRNASEASMLLGRLFLRLADLRRSGLAASDADEWRVLLFEARSWQERADRLGHEDDGRNALLDRVRLRGRIQALAGDLEGALGTLDRARELGAIERPDVALVANRRASAHLTIRERLDLAHWAVSAPSSGSSRDWARLEAVRILLAVADDDTRTARLAPNPVAMARAEEILESVAPILGEMCTEGVPATGATFSLALQLRARLFRIMVRLPAIPGRTAEGHALWKRDLMTRAADDDRRAAEPRR